MWYEKNWVISVINFFGFLSIFGILLYVVRNPFIVLPVILLIYALIIYDSIVSYNRAIDKTVDSLAKHYEKQLMEEIKKAVNKAMGM